MSKGRPNLRVRSGIAAAQHLQKGMSGGVAYNALSVAIDVLQSDKGTQHPQWARVSQDVMEMHQVTRNPEFKAVMAGLSALE